MERGLYGDLALVKAWKGDAAGNLVYRKTARNFNPMMATAGRVTVAEVEALVPVGDLDPDNIHTPGVYIDRVLEGAGCGCRAAAPGCACPGCIALCAAPPNWRL